MQTLRLRRRRRDADHVRVEARPHGLQVVEARRQQQQQTRALSEPLAQLRGERLRAQVQLAERKRRLVGLAVEQVGEREHAGALFGPLRERLSERGKGRAHRATSPSGWAASVWKMRASTSPTVSMF